MRTLLPRHSKTVQFGLALLLLARLGMAAGNETEVNDIKISLVNEDGRAIKLYAIPTNADDRNIFFRLNVDPRYQGYKSAVIEISDKEKGLNATIDLGNNPRSIARWDGQFSAKKEIEPGHRYLVRGLLVLKNGKRLSSAWSPFSTKKRSLYDEARRVRQKSLALFVVPYGAVHSMLLVTKNEKTFLFPNIAGNIELIYEDTHTLMLKIEATSNILFGYKPTSTSYFYSDISLYYKYRLLGAPIRSPTFPPEDPTGRGTKLDYKNNALLFGNPLNAEVGFRFFSTTLRGSGGSPLDSQLPRHFEGMAAGLWIDQAIDPVRLYLSGELGYSLFTGKMISGNGEVSIVYSKLANFAPGIQLRVQLFKGKALPDAFSGTTKETDVTNLLVMTGVVLKFKL